MLGKKILNTKKDVEMFISRYNRKKKYQNILSYLLRPSGKRAKFSLNAYGGSYTDDKVLVVGLGSNYYGLSEAEMDVVGESLVVHEAQHMLSSNFPEFHRYITEETEKMMRLGYDRHFSQNIVHSIGNIIEDGRIERIASRKLSGAGKKLQFKNLLMWNDYKLNPKEGTTQLIMNSILMLAKVGLHPQGYNATLCPDVDEAIEKIKPHLVKGVMARTCKDGLDECRLILEVVEPYLRAEYEQIKEDMQKMQELMELLKQLVESSDFKGSDEVETNDGDSESAPSPHVVRIQIKSNNTDETEDEPGDESEEDETPEMMPSETDDAEGSNDETKEDSSDSSTENESNEESEEDSSKTSADESENPESEELEMDTNSSSDADGTTDESDETNDESDKDSDSSSKDNDTQSDDDSNESSECDDSEDENSEKESNDASGNDDSDDDSEDDSEDENSEKESNDASGNDDSDDDSDDGKSKGEHSNDDLDEEPEMTPEDLSQGMTPDTKESTPEMLTEDEVKELFQKLTQEVSSEAEVDLKPVQVKKETEEDELTEEELNTLRCSFNEVKRDYALRSDVPSTIRVQGKKFKSEVKKIFQNRRSMDNHGQIKGMLNQDDLFRTAMGQYDVFTIEGAKNKSDYAVFVLQDGSGSMHGEKEQESAYALGIFEEGLKDFVSLKAVTFDSDDTVNHYIVKNWNEKESKNYAYSYLMNRRAGNYNDDGVSIEVATMELMKRPESEKILIVLSDGLPSNRKHVKDAVKNARKNGIHVFGIMFGDSQFQAQNLAEYTSMYQYNIIATQPSKIPSKLVQVMKTVLKHR